MCEVMEMPGILNRDEGLLPNVRSRIREVRETGIVPSVRSRLEEAAQRIKERGSGQGSGPVVGRLMRESGGTANEPALKLRRRGI